MTSAADIRAAVGSDPYVSYDIAPAELASAVAVGGAVAVQRQLKKHGISQIFFGDDGDIESLIVWLLDEAAHMDTVPFHMAQVPSAALPALKRHAILGRGDQWYWMWTQAAPAEVPWEDRVVELNEDTDGKAITRFLKQASPLSSCLPGDGRNQRWIGVRGERGEILGTIGVYPTPAGYAHLASVAVAEKLRGTGLGKAMLAVAVRRAVEDKGVCTLGMYDSNEAAERLYRSLGFSIAHHWATYHVVAGKS